MSGSFPGAHEGSANPWGTSRFAWLAITLLLAAGCGRERAIVGAGTRIGSFQGTVTISGRPAEERAELVSGEVLEVAPGAQAELVFPGGGSSLVRGGETNPARFSVQSSTATASEMVIELLSGVARFLLPAKHRTPLTVKTRHSTVSAPGTEFLVDTADSGDRVTVRRGQVEVTGQKGGASTKLSEGQQLRVTPDGVVGRPEPYDWTSPAERAWWGTSRVETQKGGQ